MQEFNWYSKSTSIFGIGCVNIISLSEASSIYMVEMNLIRKYSLLFVTFSVIHSSFSAIFLTFISTSPSNHFTTSRGASKCIEKGIFIIPYRSKRLKMSILCIILMIQGFVSKCISCELHIQTGRLSTDPK